MVVERCNRGFGSETVDPTQVYLEEFVANVLRDNIGIVIFDLRGHGGCWEAKNTTRRPNMA